MTVKGLVFEVTSEELKRHLKERAAHHKERADHYDKLVKEAVQAGALESGVTGDTLSRDRLARDQHVAKRRRFAFWWHHLVNGETYELSDYDLEKLEFIAG